jgi:hypothetical protein
MMSRIGSGSQPPSSQDGLSRQTSNRASATTPTSAGVATDTLTPSSSAAAAGGTPAPIDGGTDNVVVAGEDANVTVGSKSKLKSDVWLEFEQVTVGGKLKAECNWCNKHFVGDSKSGTTHVTPGFKGQSRVHLIHAPKKTTYIITECIEINVIKHQSIY